MGVKKQIYKIAVRAIRGMELILRDHTIEAECKGTALKALAEKFTKKTYDYVPTSFVMNKLLWEVVEVNQMTFEGGESLQYPIDLTIRVSNKLNKGLQVCQKEPMKA